MFYDTFKALCKGRGVSPSRACIEMGLSRSLAAKWKNTKATPSAEVLSKIAQYFGVTVDCLIGRSCLDPYNPPASTRPGSKWIPVLGQVVAGVPIEAVEEVLDWEEIDAKTAAQGEHFALKIKGDSMEPMLMAGDVVIVRRQPTADNGDIVVALVNGDEATVKRIKVRADGLMLIPNNPAYEPIFYTNDELESLPLLILGVAIEVRRSLYAK
ncbi:MAG TPA: S24 family peptidase [Candidatus Acidoferrum sp.]|nr:S24 family peptidase [Candidatus Acidoferrum sp.]